MKRKQNDIATMSVPSPSRWRKRIGVAGLASAGGLMAFLTARNLWSKDGSEQR